MDGGILSQDEINALLSGMSGDAPAAEPDENPVDNFADTGFDPGFDLTDVEKDAIGEVANISMGTSATTLYSLVNRKVNITTPVVSLSNWADLQMDRQKPCVFIQIKYTTGLDGSNILILKEHDVKVITDLMMGGDGTNTEGELGELHLSAISEAMNQMMGSSATSLSQMLGKMIDISPPVADLVDMQREDITGDQVADFLAGTFVKIAFRMQIDDLVDSTILQLYPVDFAREVVNTFMGDLDSVGDDSAAAAPEPAPVSEPTPAPAPAAAPMGAPVDQGMPMMGQMDPNMQMAGGMYMNPAMMNPAMMNPAMMNPGMMANPYAMPQGMPQTSYQPASFQNFQGNPGMTGGNGENIDLIMDVPLEVTVELGRTKKSIKDILEFAPGTIIELERIAGEPIDVLVNGKFVAKGEVVVIEENFGIRVTEITK